MRKSLLGFALLASIAGCAGAPAQDDDGFALDNVTDDGKADSVKGKYIHPTQGALFQIVEGLAGAVGPANCNSTQSDSSGQRFFCNHGWGSTKVTARTDTDMWMIGDRTILEKRDFLKVDISRNADVNLTEAITTKFGLLIHHRANDSEGWVLAACENRYWSPTVMIDNQGQSITDLNSNHRESFGECGINAGEQFSVMVLPTSSWFTLRGEYYYDIEINDGD